MGAGRAVPALSVTVTETPPNLVGKGSAAASATTVASPRPNAAAIDSGATAGPVKPAARTIVTGGAAARQERLVSTKVAEFNATASSAETLAGEAGLS